MPTHFQSNFTLILSFDSYCDYHTVKVIIIQAKLCSTYIINILIITLYQLLIQYM